MATFTVSIDTDNAAFDEDLAGEVARILNVASADVDDNGVRRAGPLFDTNGNTVGSFGWAE